MYIYRDVGLLWSIREASELWNDLTGMKGVGVVDVVVAVVDVMGWWWW